MEVKISPFAIVVHGDSTGVMHSFFYGIDRANVIKNLRILLEDYERIEQEVSKEVLTYGKNSNSD